MKKSSTTTRETLATTGESKKPILLPVTTTRAIPAVLVSQAKWKATAQEEKKQKAVPRVVHCQREALQMQVYVGRPHSLVARDIPGAYGEFGNPFVVGQDGTRDQVLALFAHWLVDKGRREPEWITRIKSVMRGKNLGCWCAPLPCHADLYLAIANESPQATQTRFMQVKEDKVASSVSRTKRIKEKSTTLETSFKVRTRVLQCHPLAVVAFTDGSCLKNPGGPCGAGLLLCTPSGTASSVSGERLRLIADGECNNAAAGIWLQRALPLGQGTNNVGELMAIFMTLAAVSCRLDHLEIQQSSSSSSTSRVLPSELLILTDSEYAQHATQGTRAATKNQTLIKQIREMYVSLSSRLPISIQHIRAHARIPGNEAADILAKCAAHGKSINLVLGK